MNLSPADETKELRIGPDRHVLSLVPEAASIDLYRREAGKVDQGLYHAGQISHKVTVRRQLGQSTSAKLKARQAEELAAKHGRR